MRAGKKRSGAGPDQANGARKCDETQTATSLSPSTGLTNRSKLASLQAWNEFSKRCRIGSKLRAAAR
jgi:hypothetical protein